MQLTEADVWRHLDGLTKPPRSLGRLEELAVRLCVIQQTLAPQSAPRRLVIFAADHGVVASGVTAWPREVTGAVVRLMCEGKAASTVLARQSQTEVVVANVGTYDEPMQDTFALGEGISYRQCRVRAGTRNLGDEPALTLEEFEQAWQVGVAEAEAAQAAGMRVVVGGEMGIGNTTATACLAALLTGMLPHEAVGRGAGANDEVLSRKRAIVEFATERARRLWRNDPRYSIASVAGLEIVAMAGFYAAAASAGLTIILDGAIAGAAALIAEHQSPGTARSMIAAHRSTEPSHDRVLEHLGLAPLLDWNLRLGEGTGGLLLLPLIDAAAAITSELASLTSLDLVAGSSA